MYLINILQFIFLFVYLTYLDIYKSHLVATKMREQNSLENDSSSQDVENSSKKETMKVILECLEDVQADFGEAQNTNDAIVEDFIEEIQVRFEYRSVNVTWQSP